MKQLVLYVASPCSDSWVVAGQGCYSTGGPALLQAAAVEVQGVLLYCSSGSPGGPALLQQWKSRGSCSTAAVEVQGVLLYCSSGSPGGPALLQQWKSSCKGSNHTIPGDSDTIENLETP
ncbi:hypothetical protein CesoFtcFv8_013329 [Champsocephalus esox]|uniref:Uncharacterized protein n=1 Tax=Champsocephalus esox TaxID=159716 RepID=A0AAN8BXQ1_9TELE|nr:hypothetical protein CesoFtcFv8_013329 [Champsocephalus esox]